MKRKVHISLLISVLAAYYTLVLPAAQTAMQDDNSSHFVRSSLYSGVKSDGQQVKTGSEEEEDKPEQSTVSEVSFDIVIPSFTYEFGIAIFVWREVQCLFEICIEPIFPDVFWEVAHPYFDKLFERTIAINAP